MKKTRNLLALVFTLTFLFSNANITYAQLPCNVLVGYYQTSWGDEVQLADINDKYNVICLAFLEAGGRDGVPNNNTINNLDFYHFDNTQLKKDIPVVQAKGKKVLFSIGGANGSFKLDTDTDVNTFVSKTKNLISTYKVDGIDIDIEQSIYLNQSGTISAPSTHIANLIKGLQQLLDWYQETYSKKMILTLVPETAYVTGGLSTGQTSSYGVAYLPIMEALRNDIDLVMMQLYNAHGGNYGLDGKVYNHGTIDFIVSQTEAVIQGFTCQGGRGVYSGLPASKIAVALPATTSGAGAGYVTPENVKLAMDYLRGIGSKPGSYTLRQTGGYPALRGMTTWSVNVQKDAGDEFATNYASMFTECTVTTSINEDLLTNTRKIYPNPAKGEIFIEKPEQGDEQLVITNSLGQVLIQQTITEPTNKLDISALASGLYLVKVGNDTDKLIIE